MCLEVNQRLEFFFLQSKYPAINFLPQIQCFFDVLYVTSNNLQKILFCFYYAFTEDSCALFLTNNVQSQKTINYAVEIVPEVVERKSAHPTVVFHTIAS